MIERVHLIASVSMTSLFIYKNLDIVRVSNTKMTLMFDNNSIKHFYKIVEEMLVKVDNFFSRFFNVRY